MPIEVWQIDLQWICSRFLTWCKLTGPNGFCKMQTWRTLRCNNSLSADLQQTESLSLTSSTGFQRMQHSLYVMMVQIKPVATKLVRCEVTLPVSNNCHLRSHYQRYVQMYIVHCIPSKRNKIPITRQEKEILGVWNVLHGNKCNIGNFTFPPAFTLKALYK